MKKLSVLFLAMGACLSFVACEENPADIEQYKHLVYLVGAENMDKVHEVELDYNAEEWSEIPVSVAISGTQLPTEDITVNIAVDPEGVKQYNDRYHPNDIDAENKLTQLDAEHYNLSSTECVIKAGEAYGAVTLLVNSTVFVDNPLAVIPLKISSSECDVNEENSSILIKVLVEKPVSVFAGTYTMYGQRIDYWWGSHSAEGSTWEGVVMSSTDDLNVVSLLADTPEINTNPQYAPSISMNNVGITFTFNDDMTVSVASYASDPGCIVGQYNQELQNWEGYWMGCADPTKPVIGTYTYDEETGAVVITVDYAFIQFNNCCYGFRGTYTKVLE